MSGNASASPDAPPPGSIDDDEISLLDLAETIAEHLRLLLIGPLVFGLIALGGAFLVTPTFTATTLLMPPQSQQSAASSLLANLGVLGGATGGLGAIAGLKNPNDQFVGLLKSRTIADRMIDRFDLLALYDQEWRLDARKQLAKKTQITSGKDGLIMIEVDDHSPKRAADMARAYVEEFSRLLGSLAITEAQQRRVFFERQLKLAKDQLTTAEIALTTGGIEADVFKSSPQAAVSAVAMMQAQITAQEVKLGAMRGYLTESAPEFKQALIELQVLRGELAKMEVSGKANGQPGSEAPTEYITRFRDFKYYETLFELFAKQYEIAKVDESREGAVIQIVDQAEPPELKSSPKRALIAIIATLAAGFALLLFVFVRKALANAAKDEVTAARLQRLRSLLLLRSV